MSQSQGPWPGRFVWHDLMTKDAAKAQAFYTSLFDWQINEVPMQGFTYRMILCGPGAIGGIVEEQGIPMAHWMPYVGVNDVDATAAKIQELGGSVCVPPTDIPQTGRFAVVSDPQGAYFSIYKGLPDSPGFDPDLPVPGRICWNETYSTDDEAGQKFYSAVFGWRGEPKDMGPAGIYRVQMLGDKQVGGMMKHPMPGMPSCWVCYFFVNDLTASTAKAKELGATAMMEGIPIPEVGSFSMLTDPTGAMFALFMMAPGTGPC
jgi:predicted enzyme related to lactoylglutathione lyase